jgi:pSer/pThr/pTyr-binding forkhead associated (FHA) protein
MQCPSCKEQIDGDSRFCDQCGEQIFICSQCGRPGKGKRCIFDGKEMVPAGDAGQQSSQTTQINQSPPAQAAQPPAQTGQTPVHAAPPPPQPAQPPVQQSFTSGDKIKLSSQNYGIMIEAAEGDTLGRRAGPFTGIFGRFPQISGAHCKIVKTDGNWHVLDLGSTNGTFYNNSRLTHNSPVLLQSGTNIKLADLELLITFDTGGGTVRI